MGGRTWKSAGSMPAGGAALDLQRREGLRVVRLPEVAADHLRHLDVVGQKPLVNRGDTRQGVRCDEEGFRYRTPRVAARHSGRGECGRGAYVHPSHAGHNRASLPRAAVRLSYCPPELPGAPPALRNGRRNAASCFLPAQPDLFHERYQVVEQVLLDDLPLVVPSRYRAELDVERLAGRRDVLPVGPLHRPSHGAREARD